MEQPYKTRVVRDHRGNTHVILVDPMTMDPLPPVPHMDYPKMLYGAGGVTRIVLTPEEHTEATNSGQWYDNIADAPGAAPAAPSMQTVDVNALREQIRAELLSEISDSVDEMEDAPQKRGPGRPRS